MKKISIFLLVLFLAACMISCGKEEEIAQNSWPVYYVSNSETKVEARYQEILSASQDGILEELLEYLSESPGRLECKAPLQMGFELLGVKLEDKTLHIDVSASYLELPVTTEVLVRAAIVRTLTQLESVRYVMMTVEGNQLYDSTGSMVGRMNADMFIVNDSNAINTHELARVRLYFAEESGTQLVAAYREKHYSTNTSIERLVVEELIAGPSGQIAGLYPSINPETKIINVTTKDGICYVNLDESFLTVVNNVSTEVSIYSIVNSLAELNNVSKVQILVNGEIPSSFPGKTFVRNLDIVTVLE